VAGRIAYGYKSNEVGFGWTNAVALFLARDLLAARKLRDLHAQ